MAHRTFNKGLLLIKNRKWKKHKKVCEGFEEHLLFIILLHFLLWNSLGCLWVSKEMPPTQLLFKQGMGPALEAIWMHDSHSLFLFYPLLLFFNYVFSKGWNKISIKCKISTLNNAKSLLEKQSLWWVLPRMPCFFPFNAALHIYFIKFL